LWWVRRQQPIQRRCRWWLACAVSGIKVKQQHIMTGIGNLCGDAAAHSAGTNDGDRMKRGVCHKTALCQDC
jgi:hypothetical protein